VNWAKAYYSQTEINNPHDVMQKVPGELASEIKKLDALLYGGQQQNINFELIVDGVRQLMARDNDKSSKQQPDMLEPLYK
jgi:hypothetical protein